VDHVAGAVLAAALRASADRGLTVYQVASSAVHPLHTEVFAAALR
jgi:hypothetical protein